MELITLNTKNTTYQMGISTHGFLLHLYYGPKLNEESDTSFLLTYYDRGFSGNPYEVDNDRTFSLDILPQEYPCYGNGDYRHTAFSMSDAQGVFGCDLRYVSHRFVEGKYHLPDLPSVYASSQEARTLEIVLADQQANVEVTLLYGILSDLDVITRAVKIRNIGKEDITLSHMASASLDFLNGDFDLVHFYGRHGKERTMERQDINHGITQVGSLRGTSSHQHNPFVMLCEKETTEDHGGVYGMMMLYSGNFVCTTEKDQMNQVRLMMGLQEEMMAYPLSPDQTFVTPEVAMIYSAEGFNGYSHLSHELIRDHITRGPYKKKRRPILINNWEATYFDFTGDKIVAIAKEAAKLGVEMMVLDDGWFGGRNHDQAGLGDWVTNEKKMGGPLLDVSRQIKDLGMKFGLWIEPEMVNEDSDLYRAHPDWAFTIPGRKPVRGRYQLVLDFSREEVVNHVYEQIAREIEDAKIDYIKMDMNRSICDVYSAVSKKQNYGVIMHQYVLGVYRFLELLLTRFPDILIEGCSGGGGRFDAGMLYYTPQIWCSDNTDAMERITIQRGTSYAYPISSVGSHVSAVPNEQTGRMTDIKTRAIVAMGGSFGYELDLNLITDEEKEAVKGQIDNYKKYWSLINEGAYYRLETLGGHDALAWSYVKKDKEEALVHFVTTTNDCNIPVTYVKCAGLDGEALYQDEKTATIMSGNALMHTGYPVPVIPGEYKAFELHLIKQ